MNSAGDNNFARKLKISYQQGKHDYLKKAERFKKELKSKVESILLHHSSVGHDGITKKALMEELDIGRELKHPDGYYAMQEVHNHLVNELGLACNSNDSYTLYSWTHL